MTRILSRERFFFPMLLDFLGGAIARRVIGCGVIAKPIGNGLNEPRSFTGAGRGDRRID